MESAVSNSLAFISVTLGADFERTATCARQHIVQYLYLYIKEFHEVSSFVTDTSLTGRWCPIGRIIEVPCGVI
jgi:hypothetical protein